MKSFAEAPFPPAFLCDIKTTGLPLLSIKLKSDLGVPNCDSASTISLYTFPPTETFIDEVLFSSFSLAIWSLSNLRL